MKILLTDLNTHTHTLASIPNDSFSIEKNEFIWSILITLGSHDSLINFFNGNILIKLTKWPQKFHRILINSICFDEFAIGYATHFYGTKWFRISVDISSIKYGLILVDNDVVLYSMSVLELYKIDLIRILNIFYIRINIMWYLESIKKTHCYEISVHTAQCKSAVYGWIQHITFFISLHNTDFIAFHSFFLTLSLFYS